MYYGHFGLSQPPFRITPDTEFFYSGGNRGPILEALIYAIGQGEGMVKVTGEVGSGKTMLCSMLQARLPPNVETVYIVNPSVSPQEILYAIALELHLKPPRDAGHLEVMQLLHHHLLERHAQDKQVVMFVEESQTMPIATLEEIRLLSNLETAHNKLLQIVLFGQPEFEENLRQPEIRQLRERITHSFRLSPLKHDEIRDYLNFRLRAAGYGGPDLFSASVIKAITKASGGLTRRINLIADKALLAAFSENTHTIKLKHVRAAVRDSEFSNYERSQPRLRWGWALSLFAIGAVLGVTLFVLLQPLQHDFTQAREQPSGAAPSQPLATAEPNIASAATPVAAENATSSDKTETTIATAPPLPLVESPKVGDSTALSAPTSNPERPVASPAEHIKVPSLPTVSANSQTANRSVDALDQRVAATQTWLAQQAPNTYSIQLLGTDNPQQLKNHLNVISKYVEINDIFVYRTLAKEKPSLTVLYGAFSDRQAARDALSQLPVSLKAYKPILRTVQGIRAEIAHHQPS